MNKRHRQLTAQLSEYHQQKTALQEEARAIGEAADGRLRTDAENKRVEEILASLEDLKPLIERVEAEVETEAKLASHERSQIISITPNGGALAHEFKGLGEFLQAIAVQASSEVRYRMGAQMADPLIAKLNAYQAAASGMNVGTPSDGGFLVRKDWSTAMLDRAKEQAVLLPRTKGVPIGGDFDGLEYPYIKETSRATGSRWGGVQVFWKPEAGTAAAKAPKIGKGELRLEEIVGYAYATERLLRDSSAMETLLGNSFESEFGFVVDDAIIRGTGVGQPKGFFTSEALVSVAKESAQVADTVVAANILKMWARMPARLKAGAVWLIHSDVMTQLPLMAIGQQPVWLPPGQLTQAPSGLLLGKPVIEIEQAEALGDQGDIFLVNLNEYVTITKAGEGLRYDTSMHVRFLNDEMAFRWVYRINGQPTWETSLTPYKGSSNLSPFVTLDARA